MTRVAAGIGDHIVRRLARLADSRRQEGGYITILVSFLLASGTLFACLAISVDTSRWYDEIHRVQRAADAAALAGVPFMPFDLTNATLRAKEVAKRNGYDDASADVVITVEKGALSSQLKVTISSRIDNTFGDMIGVGSTTLTRTATADYKGPAPMGSPCNTFANEPDAGAGVSQPAPAGTALGTELTACKRSVDFWAGIQGIRTSKSNGDRYMNSYCSSSYVTHECTSTTNNEYDPTTGSPGKRGYVWVVRVQPEGVGQQVKLQLYDPAYMNTGSYTCASLPASTATGMSDTMNPYVTDGLRRYSSNLSPVPASTGLAPYCNGDTLPGDSTGSGAPTTTFVLRAQTDTQDPMQATPMVTEGCVKQYRGTSTVPTANSLRSASATYNEHLARMFHNWIPFCTFTPTRAGDYFLQVRTNVTFAGPEEANTGGNASMISSGTLAAYAPSGNITTGVGNNTFAMRAVMPTGLENTVAVAGYERMPIFANATAASSEFHLIRVLPGAAGQYISFSFFDVSDAGGTGNTIKVLPPTDATGTITSTPFPSPGCQAYFGSSASTKTTLTDCTAPVSSTSNNAKVETLEIPIPSDYDCDASTVGGCWYRVVVDYESDVHDFTTWDATIIGDPVRLIE